METVQEPPQQRVAVSLWSWNSAGTVAEPQIW